MRTYAGNNEDACGECFGEALAFKVLQRTVSSCSGGHEKAKPTMKPSITDWIWSIVAVGFGGVGETSLQVGRYLRLRELRTSKVSFGVDVAGVAGACLYPASS
jgi:hypothetical protein